MNPDHSKHVRHDLQPAVRSCEVIINKGTAAVPGNFENDNNSNSN